MKEWEPGDPLYTHPWDTCNLDAQFVRSLVSFCNDHPNADCEACFRSVDPPVGLRWTEDVMA